MAEESRQERAMRQALEAQSPKPASPPSAPVPSAAQSAPRGPAPLGVDLYWALGIGACLIGGLCGFLGWWFVGIPLLALGGIWVQIAVIALGVRVGIRGR